MRMACYLVPTAAAFVHFIMRRKIPSMKGKYHQWLNQLFLGGAVFGIVDHAWNRELLWSGKNLASDMALGVTITLTIILIWTFMVAVDKAREKHLQKSVH